MREDQRRNSLREKRYSQCGTEKEGHEQIVLESAVVRRTVADHEEEEQQLCWSVRILNRRGNYRKRLEKQRDPEQRMSEGYVRGTSTCESHYVGDVCTPDKEGV